MHGIRQKKKKRRKKKFYFAEQIKITKQSTINKVNIINN